MKRIIPVFILFATLGIGNLKGQDLTKPKSGNAIRLKDYSLTLNQGQEVEAKMWVVKSKKYKLSLDEPKANAKEGITFSFTEGSVEDDPIVYGMKIKVADSVPEGEYLCILKVPGTGRNAVTGTTINIKVIK